MLAFHHLHQVIHLLSMEKASAVIFQKGPLIFDAYFLKMELELFWNSFLFLITNELANL